MGRNYSWSTARINIGAFINDIYIYIYRVNINNNFSTWEEIIAGVPQGSILGPL